MWIIPFISTIISFSLFISLMKQFIQRKKTHQLLYATSLLMFSIATFTEFYSEVFGLSTFIYKTYYFTAITLVAVMAAGTIYLISRDKKWISHVFLLYVSALTIWLLFLIPTAETLVDISKETIYIGGEGMPSYIRNFSFPLSGIGGMALIGGALYSYWKTKYKGNLYIALGAIVMASAGRLAAMGLASFLSASELIGVILLYYGVRVHPSSNK